MNAKHAAVIRLALTDVRMPRAVTYRLITTGMKGRTRALYLRAAEHTINRAIVDAYEHQDTQPPTL